MWPFDRRRPPGPLLVAGGESRLTLDLALTIVEIARRGMTVTIVAAAVHEGAQVGFTVDIEPWGPSDSPLAKVTLRSSGADSNSFVAALDRLAGTDLSAKTMRQRIDLSAVVLEGDAAAIHRHPAVLKLFHEDRDAPGDGDQDDADGDQFEWYLEVDPRAGVIRLNEKDADYRETIVRVLSGAQ